MHRPVMLNEAINFLNLKKGDTVLDATIGGGGHAGEILNKILPGGMLIGLDADGNTLNIAENNLNGFKGHFKLINENFRNMDGILSREGIKGLDGCLFDLGISSYQMDDGDRGFSIANNGRLDMRMDRRNGLSAYDVINRLRERELSEVIEKFGEERFHNRIARFITQERVKKPIETTQELASIIRRAIGRRNGYSRIDPATRTFQAIRIYVNNELASLEEGIKAAITSLNSGGRIVVISFHSLEDRIVKNLFKGYAKLGVVKIVTKKPLKPSDGEISQNLRSRSAKLRVAERLEL